MRIQSLITVLISVLLHGNVKAQELQHYKFIVDGKTHFAVFGYVPGSAACFYSESGGGQLLKAEQVRPDGSVAVIADRSFQPAFVVNRTNETSKVKGNGQYLQWTRPEFELSDIQLRNKGEYNELSWNCMVADGEEIVFQVLKSTNGRDFAILEEVGVSTASNYTILSVPDRSDDRDLAAYAIRVVNQKKGTRHTTDPMSLNGSLEISVSPSPASANVIFSVKGFTSPVSFEVYSLEGKLVGEDMMTSDVYSYSLGDLPPGVYTVLFKQNDRKKSMRFTKL